RNVRRRHSDRNFGPAANRRPLDPEFRSFPRGEQSVGNVEVHVHRLQSRQSRVRLVDRIRNGEHEPHTLDTAGWTHVSVSSTPIRRRDKNEKHFQFSTTRDVLSAPWRSAYLRGDGVRPWTAT